MKQLMEGPEEPMLRGGQGGAECQVHGYASERMREEDIASGVRKETTETATAQLSQLTREENSSSRICWWVVQTQLRIIQQCVSRISHIRANLIMATGPRMSWFQVQQVPRIRGAKSGGTGEPGSQKVNQSSESFWDYEGKFLKPP